MALDTSTAQNTSAIVSTKEGLKTAKAALYPTQIYTLNTDMLVGTHLSKLYTALDISFKSIW